jgi:hypothetical protein
MNTPAKEDIMSHSRSRQSRVQGRVALAAASAALGLAALVACTTGDPAAPEGSEIVASCEYVPGTRQVAAGNFDAIVKALVLDATSDVPQVGVGVYFIVSNGPGVMEREGPILTDSHGRAQAILVARGAIASNAVTVSLQSGEAHVDIKLDVLGCFSQSAEAPVAAFTLNPDPPRVGSAVTADFATSSDADCPTGDPESWTIRWGDGQSDTGMFATDHDATHDYADNLRDTQVTIEVEVADCTGLRNITQRTVTLGA